MFMIDVDTDLQQVAIPVVDDRFGRGTGPIFLNQLNCEGEESDLLSCGSPAFVHFCTHEQDVGISCPGYYSGVLLQR